ncbi:hypothetical protein [Acinetobacter variabilis]|uniref:hypothetical protein n=1 Tax=Acinetobacter variabilis TaxID=70346 RepID=UPI0028A0FEE8|nr:hypothetical protein [Acinetobacter variabilis]
MATDVDVQFFSHLNGLTLSNNWGDLIRLLDKALVTGIDFTQITEASINEQGNVHITLYSAHNAMLFQVVEMTGFTPQSLNQKYRIKGVPSTTQLILKPETDIIERSITITGAAKLASLGYDIIFRDTNDVKRVYRAKNPTEQHPFIRVDESTASDTGTYTATYAKAAMVGLLEHMDHIDDLDNELVYQLPYDPENITKNWDISGTGTAVMRGWSKWYWFGSTTESGTMASPIAQQKFTLFGDKDAFYFLTSHYHANGYTKEKYLNGCGLFDSALDTDVIPNWFLMTYLNRATAASSYISRQSRDYTNPILGSQPLTSAQSRSAFFLPKYNLVNRLSAHVSALGIMPGETGGRSNLYPQGAGALSFPFNDADGFIRGTLKHVAYCGKSLTPIEQTTPYLYGNEIYLFDSAVHNTYNNFYGGFYVYLGNLGE